MEGEEQHDHDDFVSFIVSLGEVADREALLKRIAADHRQRMTSCASRASSMSPALRRASWCRPWARASTAISTAPGKTDERRGTELVVIGEKHMDRAAIEGRSDDGGARPAALMHLLATTSGVIDGAAEAVDLGQSPGRHRRAVGGGQRTRRAGPRA